ncbi:prevent-host-death protein [Microlunatus elymi]|uniref:Prevent-host-death protein n=1 Tax=Microlunatus elymi TaxID=2596828 RepID=A0A516Q3L1_9ACTN|nr:prevent-host-death protein [Microlunatus elymi]QDP98013.1 prevent-host-death protein [Microlunatus elymi]
MTVHQQISQRDLRHRSREIMDAVELGESFTVTRDGRDIGELVPLRTRRTFVSRAEFVAASRAAATMNLEQFRAEQDDALDDTMDRYAR